MHIPADTDRGGPGPGEPRWPLDSMKLLGAKRRYLESPKGPAGELGTELAALLFAASEREASARGLLLVQALQPADFVGTEGVGDDTYDVYVATYAGRRLRVGLMPYRFDGWPLILMIAIRALRDVDAAAADASR